MSLRLHDSPWLGAQAEDNLIAMANNEHVKRLREGVEKWNKWRAANANEVPDLSGANLSQANLSHESIRLADLSQADLSEANLSQANLRRACLIFTDLTGANLRDARLDNADL